MIAEARHCERSEALAPSDNEAVVIDFTDVEPVEKPETVFCVEPIHSLDDQTEARGLAGLVMTCVHRQMRRRAPSSRFVRHPAHDGKYGPTGIASGRILG